MRVVIYKTEAKEAHKTVYALDTVHVVKQDEMEAFKEKLFHDIHYMLLGDESKRLNISVNYDGTYNYVFLTKEYNYVGEPQRTIRTTYIIEMEEITQ